MRLHWLVISLLGETFESHWSLYILTFHERIITVERADGLAASSIYLLFCFVSLPPDGIVMSLKVSPFTPRWLSLSPPAKSNKLNESPMSSTSKSFLCNIFTVKRFARLIQSITFIFPHLQWRRAYTNHNYKDNILKITIKSIYKVHTIQKEQEQNRINNKNWEWNQL